MFVGTADGVGEETLVAVLVGVKVANAGVAVTPGIDDSVGFNGAGLVEHAETKQIVKVISIW